jgi:hypothetical protein
LTNDEIFFFVNEKDGSKIQDDYGIFEFVPISQIKKDILNKDPNFFSSNRGGYRGSLGLTEDSFQGKIYKISGGVTKSGKVETKDYSRQENVYVGNHWNGMNSLTTKDKNGRLIFLSPNDVSFLMSCFGIKNIFLMNQKNKKKILKAGYKEFFEFIGENCEMIKDQIQEVHDDLNKVPKEDLTKVLSNYYATKNIKYVDIFEKIINNDNKLVKLFDDYEKIKEQRSDLDVNFIRSSRINNLRRIIGHENWKKIKPKNDLVGVYNKIKKRFKSILENKYPLIRIMNLPRNEFEADIALNHVLMYIDAVDNHTEQ